MRRPRIAHSSRRGSVRTSSETVTFGEFRRLARAEAAALADELVREGDRVVVIMPQGIAAMTTFVGAMMLGAVPAFLAYPNFKVEPSKYRSGLAGVTANLSAKAVVIDDKFPDEMLECVSLGPQTKLLRAGRFKGNVEQLHDRSKSAAQIWPDSLAFIQHSAGTTGLQKGVALTHAAVLRQLGHLSEALKIDSLRGSCLQLAAALPRHGIDCGLHAAHGLP